MSLTGLLGSYPVWDRTVRWLHWYLPVAIALMWWTGEQGWFDWHSRIGYSLLVVTLTRFLWGFVGSYHARFANFLASPVTVVSYLRGGWVGGLGHNPLGGWASLALLLSLLVQGITGLFTSDDMSFEGPLSYWGGNVSSTLAEIHDINWLVLQSLIVLHFLAIAYHQGYRKEPLIQKMWHGHAVDSHNEAAPESQWRALLILAVLTALLLGVIAEAPQPPAYY